MGQQQLLLDPNAKPTGKAIAEGLGSAGKTYIRFLDELKEQDISLMEWRYYNDAKSWLSKGEYKWTTPRGANKVKPLFWLSIWEGFFKVAFFFPEKLLTELQSLSISGEMKEIITSAKPMGKTKRFFPITIDIKNIKQLKDVYAIAQFKKEWK
ncbi:MAG: DUF3788 domain-containing protein [Treponema sp.]|jgi:hypothetical protein|nr:DUF3788 domain-containing protein [Treponema sp.]